MIKEAYCSFEVAKLLNEKGFDWSTQYVYTLDGTGSTPPKIGNWRAKSNIQKPTHQMAMAWLREKGILLWVEPVLCLNAEGNHIFQWMWDGKKQRPGALHFGDKRSYNTYEEAVEESLKYCLENLI